MTTILVWVLMTYSGMNSGIQYSPPVATLADCERMKSVVTHAASCVQINMVVSK